MRKILATAVIAALAFTSTPVAAAQNLSSLSSSSPAVSDYQDAKQVLDTMVDGYYRHLTNRGFTLSSAADHLAQEYAGATNVRKAQLKADLDAAGIDITVETVSTNRYEQKYRELAATPVEPPTGKRAGAYVLVNQFTITTTIVTAR